MTLIACVDLNNGILFNHRRLSKDRKLICHILDLIGEKRLWINNYTKEIFDVEKKFNIVVDEEYITKIEAGDACFVENSVPKILEDKIDKIILYNWNRRYPADEHLNIDFNNWMLESEEEIKGSSHEKIIQKIYIRRI